AAFVVMLANCIAHARRHFVDVVNSFPSECRYVLETLREVFHFDVLAKEQGLTPQERLLFHQQNSRPLMDGLHQWCKQQFEERKVEPNSGLGKAIQYLQNHWQELTLFLREPGAPLDNNLCERALKKAILHRKNALFYRTQNGAKVGDLFMSLPYRRTQRREPFRLHDGVAAAAGFENQPGAVDAVELSRYAGRFRDRRLIPRRRLWRRREKPAGPPLVATAPVLTWCGALLRIRSGSPARSRARRSMLAGLHSMNAEPAVI